jgi:asparagine synthase (glutamine-hydrolysing)
MCGISGIVYKKESDLNLKEIEIMNQLILHRGPDSGGTYQFCNVALGFRRLAILDLSPEGNQPMHFKDKYTIIFNGEIYNYLEIRAELIDFGYIFKSNSDTEVILAAYDYWGIDCLQRFNGMWAIALLDKTKNILFCSRDRFGVKPFYYSVLKDRFVFGSEIKQVLSQLEDATVNQSILMEYLALGMIDHREDTFFEGICKLPPSHYMIFDLSEYNYTLSSYFQLSFDDKVNKLEEEALTSFEQIFRDSIRIRLRSDVSVGSCLSGGLDSSSIVAIASKEYKREANSRFIAIHAKTVELDSDESHFASIVAEHCDLDMKLVQPKHEDFIEKLEEVIYTQEEPFYSPSIFMQYFVMKEARENNCIVLLDGQGGDEILLGYERYYPAILFAQRTFSGVLNFFQSVKNSKLSLFQLIAYLFYFTIPFLRSFTLRSKGKIFKKSYLKYICTDLLEKNSRNYTKLFDLQVQELYSTQLQPLLRYEDKNSMRNSIETRLPFLDYRLVQFALSIKDKHKIFNGWTKYVLRKTVENLLPSSIVWRKNKFGFEAPKGFWNNFVDENLISAIQESTILKNVLKEKYSIEKIDHRLKWRLFNVAKWEKLYNVKLRSIN